MYSWTFVLSYYFYQFINIVNISILFIMWLKKISFSLFLLIAISTICFSQNPALSKIDKDDMKRHLTFLSLDSLQGRKLGTAVAGLDIAADYIKTNAEINGLEPGVRDYFQPVDIVSTKPDENSFLEINERNGSPMFKTTSLINLSGGLGTVSFDNEEIVFAGFGYKNAETNYDDLDGVDLAGKIVVIAQSTPEIFMEGKNFRWNSRVEREKFRSISEKKPKAIILISTPLDSENKTFSQLNRWINRQSYVLEVSEKSEQAPILLCNPEFADEIFGRKGKFKKYLTSISKKERPNSFLVKKRKLSGKFGTIIEPAQTKNIIGIVEGSDPVLKNEYVIFMAHYDHLGVGKDGDVYNGADDNGSGTVTLLEVAEAFTSLDQKPKRSVVFLWVTCEEIGMFGSNYYTNNPVYPLEKTVACINIDMDGRVYEPRDSVWNRSPKKVKDFDGLFTLCNNVWPEIKEISNSNCEKLGLIPDNSLPSKFLRSSDHYHFHKNGIPIINYATGYHADYHKVGDEVSKISFEKMKRVADLCFLVGYEIANRDKIEFEREK